MWLPIMQWSATAVNRLLRTRLLLRTWLRPAEGRRPESLRDAGRYRSTLVFGFTFRPSMVPDPTFRPFWGPGVPAGTTTILPPHW